MLQWRVLFSDLSMSPGPSFMRPSVQSPSPPGSTPEAEGEAEPDGGTSLQGVVLITGGSEGIGLELARLFAKRGHHILIVARDETRLRAARSDIETSLARSDVKIHICAQDLTAPDAVLQLERYVKTQKLYVDYLVNNAGMGLSGKFVKQQEQEIEHLITLNMTAATQLTRAFLPPMLARNRGGVLMVSSLAGFVPGAYQAAYYASKAYVNSLTQALAHEHRNTKLRICALTPGAVKTAFHAKMGAEYAPYLQALGMIAPAYVALWGIWGFRLGFTIIVPGLMNIISMLALRFTPHIITVPIMGWLLKTKKRR